MSLPKPSRLQAPIDPRSGKPERAAPRIIRAADVILAMMVALLIWLAVFQILHG